ncbi:hypothetical protein I79_012956 [Cricetulus griseus]|uniref:Uncharacterized protein n=1 Tax=Cricetulus griseus TaxID=10029 RepID=G3HQ63_CRIGR|nr:hypothetical protein I79_012956 [Cricetulus griseus]
MPSIHTEAYDRHCSIRAYGSVSACQGFLRDWGREDWNQVIVPREKLGLSPTLEKSCDVHPQT